jgi:hypothetical protein
MAIIGPIFCILSGIAQGWVLRRYADRLMDIPSWEWAVLTTLSGIAGWLLGMGLGVSLHRRLLLDYDGVVSGGMANHIVFFVWGAATGLLVGLAQAFLFTVRLRFAPRSDFNRSTRKAGAVWTAVNGVSWGAGLLLSELLLLATRQISVPTAPEDGAITPAGFALQIVSMVALGVCVSAATGATLARLLRHADTQAPPRQILIPTR